MSDFEAARKARMDAMADKKKRLEELKKMRQDKLSDNVTIAPVVDSMEQLSVKENKKSAEIDSILNSILTTDTSKGPEDVETNDRSASADSIVDTVALLEERRNALTTCKPTVHYSSAPVVAENYEKGTQTEMVGTASGDDEAEEEVEDSQAGKTSRTIGAGRNLGSPIRKRTHSEGVVGQVEAHTLAPAAVAPSLTSAQVVSAALTTNSAAFSAFLSTASKYAERALAQSESFDICVDYRAAGTSNGQVDGGACSSMNVVPEWSSEAEVFRNRPVLSISNSQFYNELYVVSYGARISRQKATKNHESGDPSGIVAVWSTVTPATPELVCYSSSSHILVAKFNPHNPKQIIGGCYNGQIILWDITTNSGSGSASEMLLPVQRSSLSGKGCHRYAIINFTIVETSLGNGSSTNSNNTSTAAGGNEKDNVVVEIISVSTDGLICHWDLSSLIEPTRSYYYNGVSSASSNVEALNSLSCISFISSNKIEGQSEQVNCLDDGGGIAIAGTEHGELYKISCPAPKTLSVVSKFPQIDAHFGLVAKMHLHPSSLATHRNNGKFTGMNNLLLTIALDWRVKLWDTGVLSRFAVSTTVSTAKASKSNTTFNAAASLLFEFVNPSYDYISDIQWSPVHPAMFACITSNNILYIWNIMQSSTEPADTVVIPTSTSAGVSSGLNDMDTAVACTQLEWNSNGKQLFVGNSAGVVYIVQLKDSVTAYSPADDSKFEALINQKKKTVHS